MLNTQTTHFRRCGQGCNAIDRTLDDFVANHQPSWQDAWNSLTSDAGSDERLRAYQTIRDSGDLPEDAALYLISCEAIQMADLQARSCLESIDQAIDKVWEDRGLEDWRANDRREAEFYPQFEERCPGHWDALFVETLLTHGQNALATLFKSDRTEFIRRYESGFHYFHSKESSDAHNPWDDWLSELVGHVVRTAIDVDVPGVHCGFMTHQGDDRPIVFIYVCPFEVVGGDQDGTTSNSTFSVDLTALVALFDVTDELTWQVAVTERRDGADPRVSVRATFRGHPVELAILQHPPEQQVAASQVQASVFEADS